MLAGHRMWRATIKMEGLALNEGRELEMTPESSHRWIRTMRYILLTENGGFREHLGVPFSAFRTQFEP